MVWLKLFAPWQIGSIWLFCLGIVERVICWPVGCSDEERELIRREFLYIAIVVVYSGRCCDVCPIYLMTEAVNHPRGPYLRYTQLPSETTDCINQLKNHRLLKSTTSTARPHYTYHNII
jgi:hypothetical protein